LGYACLVAIMSMGQGYHRICEARLHEQTVRNGAAAPVVTSAGALIAAIRTLGAKVVSVICPYMKPLAKRVVGYLEGEGIAVKDYLALEVPDNLAVARLDPGNLLDISSRVTREGIDALVLSACVQMPSLPVIDAAERKHGLPVISAAVSTTYQMLKRLDLHTHVPGGGALLSGRY
jgi:maleate isomerase